MEDTNPQEKTGGNEKMSENLILDSELTTFSKTFDTTREDKAAIVRGEFLQNFPLENIPKLTLEKYVIGRGTSSFCAYVEAKTKSWANVQGATSAKFGIYFGKIKGDPEKKYRINKRLGDDKEEAFHNIKQELLSLIDAGKSKNFQKIDENPLSQMFKAKILSLYFPEIFLNICSADHIKTLALKMGIPKQKFISEYQHLLVQRKLENEICKDWSNPKFMAFLYDKYMPNRSEKNHSNNIKKTGREVDFEVINANRDRIGKKAEEYAWNEEKRRLIGLGYENLVDKINDRRKFPSDGYDFLSYSSPSQERYIEVKSVGRDKAKGGYRFFLSDNERKTSEDKKYKDNYYFYLVYIDKNEEPYRMETRLAKHFNDILPYSYMVRFFPDDHT